MKRLTVLLAVFALAASASTIPIDLTWAPGSYQAVLVSEIAGYANSNRLLARTLIDPTPTLLFIGPDGPGATVQFAMGSEWMFLIDSPDGLFASVGGFSADGLPHFVEDSGFILVEDLWNLGDADWLVGGDGADMKFTLGRVPDGEVPEPAAFVLVGFGLLAVYLRRRIAA